MARVKRAVNAHKKRRVVLERASGYRVQRINAAVRAEGITYNRFIQGLRLAGIELDRRALAEIAVSDPDTFKTIVDAAKAALPEDVNAPVEA